MLLTITYTGHNTSDLGYLLHKNPQRPQMFELSYGNAYVFYPELSNERTTAAMLLDIDPIDLARGKADSGGGGLFDYVNDRPYVSSSFLSVAISKVFGTAMTGRADAHQELSDSPLDLEAVITMLPCRGEPAMLNKVTPNKEYNIKYENLAESDLRHSDHRFEWTRTEFHQWALKAAEKNRYTVRFSEIGDSDETLGAPTQMGVFTLCG
ncbi:MAG: hypothetical protein LBI14_02210 [Treponema sp.]|jgi:hypothetical protein|nr:hypothetical protein [Treponema sp.]